MMVNLFNIVVFSPLLLAMGRTKFYSRVHMVFAIAVWVMEYVAILVFHSPIAVAIVSVSLSVLTVVVCLIYVAIVLNVAFYELIPFPVIFKIIAHVLAITILSKLAIGMIRINSATIEFIFAFILYSMLLLSTARIFKLNYTEFIMPLVAKNKTVIWLSSKIKGAISFRG